MQVGAVITWHNLPNPQYGGKPKARWLICLGKTNPFFFPIQYYLHSITTTKREISHLNLLKLKYPFLDDNSYCYFNEKPYMFTSDELNNKDVEPKGQIDDNDLRIIYEGILSYLIYSKIEKMDLHTSFNMKGITGLKHP